MAHALRPIVLHRAFSTRVDNITATPEPTSALGLVALCSLKTWRGRKPRA